jgi:hypothetical protein
MGEAGRAGFDPFGAHYMNPATLVLGSGYMLGGAFQSTNAQLESPSVNTALVVADYTPDKIANASAGYVYKRFSYPDRTNTQQDFSLAFGFRILPKLAVGLLAHQLYGQGSNSAGFRQNNISPGLLFSVAPFWNLALVGYDVLDDSSGNMTPVSALGTEFNVLGILKLRGDIVRPEKSNPNRSANLNAGVEFDLTEGFLLRTGGIWDTVRSETYWTLGLGWMGPRLCAAYAYKNNVNLAGAVTHVFQMWVSF